MPLRSWRHWRRPGDILTHLRWSDADARRLAFYRHLIRPSDLVFDVGANMGNRSKVFRAIGARVVAFEPQSACAQFLATAFSGDPGFTLVRAGLSRVAREALLHLSPSHPLSTVDPAWMDRMNHGGRFAHAWSGTERVTLTTLDACIAQFGLPAFIKIDVEGHEWAVVEGLSHPVELVSLEFASESLDSIYTCIDHLDALAGYDYRLSLGDSMQFEATDWRGGSGIKALLTRLALRDPLVWGDLYARRVK